MHDNTRVPKDVAYEFLWQANDITRDELKNSVVKEEAERVARVPPHGYLLCPSTNTDSTCTKEISEMLYASGMVGRLPIYLFTVPVVSPFL